jgi:Carboxypeptidase regulatory-like domain
MKPVIKTIVKIVLLMLTVSISAFAQASGSSAELRGQVVDSTGAAIKSAAITITDLAKGSTRSTTTDGEGNYAFVDLLPSNYEIKVSANGFATSTGKVALTVGQQANIPFRLAAGAVEVNVEIVSGGEIADTYRTEQSSTVDAKQISNLPINRRNFLDYALLTPGVADADNIADASDLLGINNILGAACTTPGDDRFTPCMADAAATPRLTDYNLRGRRDRKPTEPLGFTSAADPRQLQFGARFNW